MDHGADHGMLRMTRHGIPSQHDDDTRHQVALRLAVALPAEPHAQQTGAPPDNTHGGVLQVIMHPRPAPAVLGKRVDAPPDGDDQGVKKLLTPAGPTQPELSDEKHDHQQDTVRDKRTAHDKVRHALSQVVVATESQRRDPAEQHLRPTHHRHGLTKHPMQDDDEPPDLPIDSLGQVQLQINTQNDLRSQQEHQDSRKRAVDVFGELATFVRVSEEVGQDGDDRSDDLEGDVPS